MKISRILHAGYVFQSEKTQIAFDPIFENPFSKNCYAYPDVRFDLEQIRGLKFDAVFISHYHDDHCSMTSLDHLDRETPIYIYCLHEEMLELIRQLGFQNVTAIGLNQSISVGAFQVTARQALDADVDSIFHIQAENLNVLNVVDSWIDPEAFKFLKPISNWDMVLWPFQTMQEIQVISADQALPKDPELPQEWFEQLQILNPRLVVPSSCQFLQESWSWYNHSLFPISYQRFGEAVNAKLPQAQILRINPGVSFTLTRDSLQTSEALPWIEPVGEQNVDYDYRPEQIILSTAEIAKHFGALSPEQTDLVLDYCRNHLRPNGPDRVWELVIFDHTGEELSFKYLLADGKMEFAEDESSVAASRTELPISRFYGALCEGESLTSMYVRIKGHDFEEDPLIHSLFTGTFAAYQKAQLKACLNLRHR